MIGERMKQARLMAAMSQDELVKALAKAEVRLTKAGLSKYERGASVPKATFLQHLAKVLQVQSAFFLEEPEVQVKWLGYRKRSGVGLRDQERIHAQAAVWVEVYLRLRAAMSKESAPSFPKRTRVRTAAEAEAAAEALRQLWGMGELPIESMTELIEDHHGIVIELTNSHDGFDGLSGVANNAHAVMIVDASAPDDRKRFTLAHELGHLLMETSAAPTFRDEERLAHRFAAAFLVPAVLARRELGEKRARLSLAELAILKQKHGLSMQGWVLRARDLNIIDEGHYETLIRQVHRRNELVEYKGKERPVRLRQMVLRACAEGIISRDQALKLCPEIASCDLMQPTLGAEEQHMRARDIMRLPAEQRNNIMARAAESVVSYYDSVAAAKEDIADDWEDIYHVNAGK